jgi:RNA polymerase sigma factor for flagellar operon FliA
LRVIPEGDDRRHVHPSGGWSSTAFRDGFVTMRDDRAMEGTGGPSTEQLVQKGLPLVQYAVSDLAGRVPSHVGRDDLVSAGMLGLAQAAKSWDPERGVTFERYARARIQGALLDELRSRDWATRSVRANARRLRAATEALTSGGEMPTSAQLGAVMGVSPQEVDRLHEEIHRATVLHYDALVTDVDESPLPCAPADGPLDTLVQRELVGYLRDAVVTLPERLRKVVVEYFFEERPMQDIADDLGVTESRVSQMRAEAIVLLRASLTSAAGEADETVEPAPAGRAAKRVAAYLAEVASASDYKMRLSADAPSVPDRVARSA